MTQMRAKPDCLGFPKNNHWHWQIDGCRWVMEGGGGALNYLLMKNVGLSDLL